MPASSSAPLRSRAAIIVVATALAAFGGGLLAAPASAAPGDDLSVAVSGIQDFGYQKQGTTVTRTLSVINDGLHDVKIDPSNLAGLAAPFSATTTINPTVAIAPNESKLIVVSYAAPAVTGMANMVTITLPVYDEIVAGASTTLTLNLRGQSLATDPAYFEAIPASTGTTLDFGTVRPGGTSSAGINLQVGGAIPLTFREDRVNAFDIGGNPISNVRVTASSFGRGASYNPGGKASVELTFTPTVLGTYAGVIQIVANESRMGGEDATVIVNLPFTALVEAAVVPTPTPTPTVTPAKAPVTPVSPAVRPAPAAGAQQLAHTGAHPEFAIGFGAITLALGGIALSITMGARRKARRG